MTLESEPWQSHTGQTRLKETKTIEAHAEETKREHLIAELIDRVHDLATGPRGLPQSDEDIDKYELLKAPTKPEFRGVLMPREHAPGKIRVGLFKYGNLWVRATAPGLPDEVLNLFIRTDGRPHEYHATGLIADPETRSMIGVEQMAASAITWGNLNRIETAVEMESIAPGPEPWPHKLSEGDLKFARIPK